MARLDKNQRSVVQADEAEVCLVVTLAGRVDGANSLAVHNDLEEAD